MAIDKNSDVDISPVGRANAGPKVVPGPGVFGRGVLFTRDRVRGSVRA